MSGDSIAFFLNGLLGRRATFLDRKAGGHKASGTIMAVTLPVGRLPADKLSALHACRFTLKVAGKQESLHGVSGRFITQIEGIELAAAGSA
jgi:hypothetical protein